MSSSRLSAPRGLMRRLRHGWQRFRPLPLPRYVRGTPKTGSDHPLDPFFPPNAPTLAAAATSYEGANFVAKLMERLTPSEETTGQRIFYLWAQDKFGAYWRNADITTVLWAAATLIRPKTYLEIGVRRGRSTAVVAATCPDCAVFGFDLWIPNYGGAPNPGPDFVERELRALGYRSNVVLVSGDSRETVPAFLRRHPDLFFDLVTVDGDHSLLGVATDLANVLPRLKVGGVVVCDDVCAPPVARVWAKVVERDSRYVAWKFTAGAYGVAAAIRVSDEPALGSSR
jgi:predicted O-methyltransferase YrrM